MLFTGLIIDKAYWSYMTHVRAITEWLKGNIHLSKQYIDSTSY